MSNDLPFALGIIILVGIIVAGAWKLISNFMPKTRCPKCAGVLDADPWRYKGVIVWTCQNCNDTFETLRLGRKL